MRKQLLYQKVAGQLSSLIDSGQYAVGDKLPDERQMASDFGVSRGVIRQAKRALQAQGRIENLLGHGTFVSAKSLKAWLPSIGEIELTEARAVFEAEIAALAALQITEDVIAELESYLDIMSGTERSLLTPEEADKAFHYAIAKATKNDTIMMMMESLWDMRLEPARSHGNHQSICDPDFNERINEHRAILDSLKKRDSNGARRAMRTHCEQVKLKLSRDSLTAAE